MASEFFGRWRECHFYTACCGNKIAVSVTGPRAGNELGRPSHTGQSNISLWSSNVRGLNSDLMDRLLADVANKHDLLGICETFLNLASNVELSIPGYLPIFRKDRLTHGGGMALYVSDSCIAKRVYNFETPTLEALWVEIKTHTCFSCLCLLSFEDGR